MIRRLVDQAFNSGKYYISAVGLSTDVKPTEGIITGSKFVEVDTGIGYLFDETSGEWHKNQQLTEAVQAYFEDHPEAIDQAAIEAMFGDQLDGIEEDIGGLKSATSDNTTDISALQTSVANLGTHKVAQPLDEYNQPTDGTDGQLLRTKGNGTTEWADVGLPTDAQTVQAVSDWLDAHPEATTTVEDGSLTEAKFSNALKLKTINDYVTPEMFGAKGDGTTDDTEAVQDAVNTGKTVYFPQKYKVGSVSINSATRLIGANSANSFILNGTGNNELFLVDSDNVIFENLVLKGEARDTALIKIINGENIIVSKCTMRNADFGIWIRPQEGDSVKRVKIINNDSSQIVHHISLGIGQHQAVGEIEDVVIDGNTMTDSIFTHVGNGIKTVQKCKNLVITNNIISEQDLDGIDLFASGNRILVSNNVIKNNYIVGIDIKRNNTDYGETIWGVTEDIDISHNIIEGNHSYGILINSERNTTKPNYLFNISNNRIIGNGGAGIYSAASYVNIVGNIIYKNACLGSTESTGITIDGVKTPIYGVIICENQIINNGYSSAPSSQQLPTGIYLPQKIHDVNICNNVISNTSDLDNPYQRYGITVGTADITNLTIKNNKISCETKDVVTMAQKNILAEKNVVTVNEIIAKTGGQEYIYTAIAETNISLVSIIIDFYGDVAQGDSTNGYVVFYPIRIDNDIESTITYHNTSSGAISKNTSLAITFDSRNQNVAFSKGDVYGIKIVGAYGGQDLPISRIVFNYIER